MPSLMAFLGLNATQFHTGLGKAQNHAKATGSSIAGGLAHIGDHLAGKLAAFASLATVEQALHKTAEYAHQMVELSKRTGLSTDTLQKWDFAATKANTSLDVLITSYEKFQIAQAKAHAGDPKFIGALQRLGLSSTQIGNLEEASQNFERIGERIKGAEINGQMLKDVTEVFGKSVRQILPVFKNDLKEAGNELERIGGLMSSKDMAAGAEAAERMKMAWFQMRPIIAELLSWAAHRLGEMADFFKLTIGVMLVDHKARSQPEKRADTFLGRIKENWHGQKDKEIDASKGDADARAAKARNEYIEKVMKEREEREKFFAKMSADLKHPPSLPHYEAAEPKPEKEPKEHKEPKRSLDHPLHPLHHSGHDLNALQKIGAYAGSPESNAAKQTEAHLRQIVSILHAATKPTRGSGWGEAGVSYR